MVCKKCNRQIADASKFCGYCGNEIVLLESISKETKITKNFEKNAETKKEINVLEKKKHSLKKVSSNLQEKSNWTLKILCVFFMIIVAITIYGMYDQSSKKSIVVLDAALTKLNRQIKNSITINVNLKFENSSIEPVNLTLKSQYSRRKDEYSIYFTADKSFLSDEILIYSRIKNENMYIYTNSEYVDKLGYTKSQNNYNLYHQIDLSKINKIEIGEIDIYKIIDTKHFKLVSETNNVKQYQLILDQELIEKFESQLSEKELKSIEKIINCMKKLGNENYIIDISIKEDNLISSISMDVSKLLDTPQNSKAILKLSFFDLGKTRVYIPGYVINSKFDLESYVNNYGVDGANISDIIKY